MLRELKKLKSLKRKLESMKMPLQSSLKLEESLLTTLKVLPLSKKEELAKMLKSPLQVQL